MNDSRLLITRKFLELFLKHFSNGGIKSIPLVGGLAEEIVFGTLDAMTANEQAAKLMGVLAEIKGAIEEQSVTTAEVLERVRANSGVGTDVTAKIGELLDVVKEFDSVEHSLDLEEVVEALSRGLAADCTTRLPISRRYLRVWKVLLSTLKVTSSYPTSPPGCQQQRPYTRFLRHRVISQVVRVSSGSFLPRLQRLILQ